MSLYPSQSSYGQASYPQYSHPVPPSGYYQYHHGSPIPPPAPVYHLDPISFRREFTNRLNELTFNSRPIIQALSMLAQEYSRYADIVAQCLEGHIRRVPPWMKLPAFYLLDAISKNVNEPYARHFASFVLPLFIDTYNLVDETTRSKMEEMLLTWRTGSPQGRELFGVPPQVAIERGIWGDAAMAQNGSGPSFHMGSSQITKSQVLCELDFTLNQKKQALHLNPYDTTSQNHVNVLAQLRKLVEVGVSQEELQQILNQLRNLAKVPTAPLAPAPLAPAPAIPASAPQWPSFSPSVVTPHNSSRISTHSITPSHPTDNLKLQQSARGTSASAPNAQAPADIANLLSTLLKAGVVSANSTPTGAGMTKEDGLTQEQPENAGLEREASRAYRQVVLSQPIKLSSSDVMRAQPQIVEMLYDQLTAQCKQCGLRFPDTIIGKKNMDDHLDMHFRQNRKANQNIGRGHSRSWFISLEDWIHDSSNDGKGKRRLDGVHGLSSKAAEAAKVDAELRSFFVVVPPGDEARAFACPICKETLKSEFLEDDEEWVWKNAIKKDDRVCHATCHAEAMTSTSSLAARLRATVGGSRSVTPETFSRATPPTALRASRSPSHSPFSQSKVVGLKRKVEDHDSTSKGEVNNPPLKKLALAS